eukprot:9149868-Pyramimonas_sp.AAC.3
MAQALGQIKSIRGNDLELIQPRQFQPKEACHSNSNDLNNEGDGESMHTRWPGFARLIPFEGDFPGSKGGGMFFNQTFKNRYCQSPLYCSIEAIEQGIQYPRQQPHTFGV